MLIAPLIAAMAADPIAATRPWGTEFGVGAGFLAFAMLLLQFALVSRLRPASDAFGVDALIQFHRHMGLAAAAMVILHVAALWSARGTGGFRDLSVGRGVVGSGSIAAVALVALASTSLWRRRMGLTYEHWRLLHLFAALCIAAGSLAHLFMSGGYTRAAAVQGPVLAYAALFAASLLHYRLLRPWRLRRRPWVVVGNRDEGRDVRSLTLQPVGHAGLRHAAGQFVWLGTGPGPFRAEFHPVTLCSSAEGLPGGALQLTIKALGDWSRTIVPALTRGTRVWIDGPFGTFSPDRLRAIRGLVLVSGGIGITPMLAILRTMRDRHDSRPVLLVAAWSSAEQELFGAELDLLRASLALQRVTVYERPPPGWRGAQGLVTRALLQRHLPADLRERDCFVCGPEPMMDAVETALLDLGVPPGQIHTERYEMV
jgi:predicted ferric reductase